MSDLDPSLPAVFVPLSGEDESMASTGTGAVDLGGPIDIAELYDPRTVALIEGQAAGVDRDAARPDRARPVVRKSRFGGAMLAGAMIGLGEVVEPEKAKTAVIEFAPDRLDENEQPVTFVMVPGNPRASRLIIRPWLRHRLRR